MAFLLDGLTEVLQLLGGRPVFKRVYHHAIRAGLFFGLQMALGILDVWVARFGRELDRAGAAREAADRRGYDGLFCSCQRLRCIAVNRDSRSNGRNLDWPGTVAKTGTLVRHVHKLDLETRRAVTGS
jgi:hypothetical protein